MKTAADPNKPKQLIRVTVTGFEVFEGVDHNPSEDAANWLADPSNWPLGAKVFSQVLATEFDWAGNAMEVMIREHSPQVILAFGVSPTRENICLERIALNIDDTDIPDNAGSLRIAEPIDPAGPLALQTTADLPTLLKTLLVNGIDAEISNYAGSYVCNHVYYRALRCIGEVATPIPCVFVHLPLYSAMWQKEKIFDAAQIVMTSLVQNRLAGDVPASVNALA